ncbi:bifunctional riboflavin kinase/FAD synthetase [Alphaproteobacteria bacterium]|nr:bifunctional riboflavin kinase/FAD synthetase [Alphaproteobacteria bacterium]
MKLHYLNTKETFKSRNLCLCIGNFDGIHLGHQHVIKKIIKNSQSDNFKSAIMTFVPHPKIYFKKTDGNFNIITNSDKKNFLKSLGVENYIEYKFNKTLSNLDAVDFIEKILVKQLSVKKIVVGKDFKFGKDRKGDTSLLKKLSSKHKYKLSIIGHVKNKKTNLKFSSSTIRKNINEGLFEKVSQALGRHWFMQGKIIKGSQKARLINFPTANMKPGNHILPKKGVYSVNVTFNGNLYKGIANFGERPTVKGVNLLLETHIFEFNKEIYGKELTVEFLTFIRSEKKFKDFKSLTTQIKKDVITAKNYHKI